MTSEHFDAQSLAQMVLAVLQPLVTAASSGANGPRAEGKCTQVWCPVCAAIAIASGEHHPLAAEVAEHAATILSLVQTIAGTAGADSPDPAPRDRPNGRHPRDDGRYQPIPVTIHE